MWWPSLARVWRALMLGASLVSRVFEHHPSQVANSGVTICSLRAPGTAGARQTMRGLSLRPLDVAKLYYIFWSIPTKKRGVRNPYLGKFQVILIQTNVAWISPWQLESVLDVPRNLPSKLSKPQPNTTQRLGLTTKWLCKPHHHHRNSISAISQLLLTRFWWNFKGRFL